MSKIQKKKKLNIKHQLTTVVYYLQNGMTWDKTRVWVCHNFLMLQFIHIFIVHWVIINYYYISLKWTTKDESFM